jgi:ABC-2 type transport system permease protein
MKTLLSFVKKEFYHILRDPFTLLIMFALPITLITLLSYAVSTEIKNIPFVVSDNSKSNDSRRLIEQLDASAYFSLTGVANTAEEVESAFRKGQCAVAITVPADFGNEPRHSSISEIQVMVDATDPNQAATMLNYCQAEIQAFQQARNMAAGAGASFVTEVKLLFNPQMLSAFSIVPGLQGMVLMIICAMMTSIAVVREKELGTMEILLVSPLKPRVIIFAKAIPYLVVSLVDVILILLLSNMVLGVPINGNILLLALLSLTYIFTALSLGMLISTITRTQQTAMIVAGMGLMLPSLLLSGLIFPIESMPAILRGLSCITPARWFIDALRDVMIKGLGFDAIWKEYSILLGMCILFMTVSIKKFSNRL